MELRAVLLDLDGTLVDTAPDMVGSLNRLLNSYDMPEAPYETANKIVSNGGKALVELGFGNTTSTNGIPATNQLVQEFLIDYKQHVAEDSFVYKGMNDVLDYCENTGLKWGVITNKPLHLAKDLLDGLGLLNRCSILLGGDSLPVKKPDPVPADHEQPENWNANFMLRSPSGLLNLVKEKRPTA